MTHISVSRLTIIGSDNGLSPGRRQAIIWTNVGILLIGSLATNFNEILVEIYTFSSSKLHLQMSSGKWWPFCPKLNVLTLCGMVTYGYINLAMISLDEYMSTCHPFSVEPLPRVAMVFPLRDRERLSFTIKGSNYLHDLRLYKWSKIQIYCYTSQNSLGTIRVYVCTQEQFRLDYNVEWY